MHTIHSYCKKCKRGDVTLQENQTCNSCNQAISEYGEISIEDFNKKHKSEKKSSFFDDMIFNQRIVENIFRRQSQAEMIGEAFLPTRSPPIPTVDTATTTASDDEIDSPSPPVSILNVGVDMASDGGTAFITVTARRDDSIEVISTSEERIIQETNRRVRQQRMAIWENINPTILGPSFMSFSNESRFVTSSHVDPFENPGKRSYKGKRKKKKKKNLYERIKRDAYARK